MAELAKTHILFPKPLLKEVDKLVGTGHRSQFVIEATEEKLKRMKVIEALKSAAGSWTDKRHPKLKTQKDINRYLKKVRAQTEQRIRQRLHG